MFVCYYLLGSLFIINDRRTFWEWPTRNYWLHRYRWHRTTRYNKAITCSDKSIRFHQGDKTDKTPVLKPQEFPWQFHKVTMLTARVSFTIRGISSVWICVCRRSGPIVRWEANRATCKGCTEPSQGGEVGRSCVNKLNRGSIRNLWRMHI